MDASEEGASFSTCSGRLCFIPLNGTAARWLAYYWEEKGRRGAQCNETAVDVPYRVG